MSTDVRHAALFLACVLGGCGVSDTTPACHVDASRAITWSNGNAPDRLIVRAAGTDCANADIIAIVTNAEGAEILRAAALGHAMAEYGDNQPMPLPPVSNAKMAEYVDSIAQGATLIAAGELPEWSGPPHLPRATADASYEPEPSLPRGAYDDLRSRNVRVLCFATGPEAATCYAYDPTTRRAVAIATHGI